jgi:biopolymer transport protein ExbD
MGLPETRATGATARGCEVASSTNDDELVAGINVTPLVDITLVLLIIFMVTAKLIAQQGIPMDLPKAATAGATQTVFTVAIDKDGAISANGKPIATDAELRAIAKGALDGNTELRTVIQASGAASHATVLHAVDALRECGITKIAFAADKVAKDAPSLSGH